MDTLAAVTKVRKSSAPPAPNSFSSSSTTQLLDHKSSDIRFLEKQFQTRNNCSICSSCSSCPLSLNYSQFSIVAEASRFDKSIMLLSALTRSRETTVNNFCSPLHNSSYSKKKGKRGKRNLQEAIQDDIDCDRLEEEKRMRIESNIHKNSSCPSISTSYLNKINFAEDGTYSSLKSKTIDSLSLPSIDMCADKEAVDELEYLKKKVLLLKQRQALLDRIKKEKHDKKKGARKELCSKTEGGINSLAISSRETQFTCPLDCISSAICKQLFAILEDMNLLVRNITKEAKALVNAEM